MAIELIVGLVPFLGYIPIMGINLTIAHIPVIITAVLLGSKAGATMGFTFALTSFLNATFLRPNPIESPLFTPFFPSALLESTPWSLLICFGPRILAGIIAALLFYLLSRSRLPDIVSLAVTGVISSLAHTLMVMGLIFMVFGEQFSKSTAPEVQGLVAALYTIISFNGFLEAALAGILTALVAKPLLAYNRRSRGL